MHKHIHVRGGNEKPKTGGDAADVVAADGAENSLELPLSLMKLDFELGHSVSPSSSLLSMGGAPFAPHWQLTSLSPVSLVGLLLRLLVKDKKQKVEK